MSYTLHKYMYMQHITNFYRPRQEVKIFNSTLSIVYNFISVRCICLTLKFQPKYAFNLNVTLHWLPYSPLI